MDSGFSCQIPTCYLSYTRYVVVLLPVDLPERLVTAPNGQQRECVLTLQSLQHNDTTLTLDETSCRDLLACYSVPAQQIHIYTPLRCLWRANQLHLVKKEAKNYKSICLVPITANVAL